MSGLTAGRTHPDSSHIHGIVSAHERHLKAHVILVVLVLIADLGNQLLLLDRRLAFDHGVNSEAGIKAKSIGCIDAHFLLVTELKKTADILGVNSGERSLDVSVLCLSQLSEVVSLEFLDVNLTIIFLTFFEILELNMRDPMLLQLNAHNLST